MHGHPIACLAVVRARADRAAAAGFRYLCGAEEKAIRVFDAPSAFLETLAGAAGGAGGVGGDAGGDAGGGREGGDEPPLPVGAAAPALGLSQRPLYARDLAASDGAGAGASDEGAGAGAATGAAQYDDAAPARPAAVLGGAPLESHLALSTLWPEVHKLYAHGDRIVALASANARAVCASAAAATSAEFARVRLWSAETGKPLGVLPEAHGVAVTALAFSPDDRLLASVGRDRALCVFEEAPGAAGVADVADAEAEREYALVPGAPVAKAHTREPRAVCWLSACALATGGRDKRVHVWAVRRSADGDARGERAAGRAVAVQRVGAIDAGVAVNALAATAGGELLAAGLDDGGVRVWRRAPGSDGDGAWEVYAEADGPMERHRGPVRALAFAPPRADADADAACELLASCGEDGAVIVSELGGGDASRNE